MDVILTHHFKDACNIDGLLDGCELVNTFCRRLEQQAAEQTGWEPNKFKGDGLECLVEFLIKYQGTDNNIGITDYQIIPGDDDTGVDGRGISTFNKRPATVQVKYGLHYGETMTTTRAIGGCLGLVAVWLLAK